MKSRLPDARRTGRRAQTSQTAADIARGAMGDSIPFYLRLAQDASFAAFSRATGIPELRPGWYAVLRLLQQRPDMTASFLCRLVGKDKSTMTSLLTQLETSGLIVRERAEHDKRVQWVRVTPAGRARLRRLRHHAIRHDRQLDRIVGAAAKAEFLAALRRIIEAFDRSATGHRRPHAGTAR